MSLDMFKDASTIPIETSLGTSSQQHEVTADRGAHLALLLAASQRRHRLLKRLREALVSLTMRNRPRSNWAGREE